MWKFLKDNFGWVKDIAIVIFIVLGLWANANFVSNERFESYQKAQDIKYQAIQVTLVSVDKTLALMQQNQTILIDNEKQIKINTAKLAEIELRTKYLEGFDLARHIINDAALEARLELRLKALETLHPIVPPK
jgi:hypothetical protein